VKQSSALLTALAGMASLAVAMGIGRFAFTPILPMMQADSGLSLANAGWLASGNYFGYFIGAFTAIGMRVSAPKFVRAVLVAIALLTAGMGIAHGFAAQLVLRMLAGVASAWVLVFAAGFIFERLAALRAPRMGGILFGGVGGGITLAGLACLLFARWSWTSSEAWIALGVVAALLTAACWPVFVAPVARDENRDDTNGAERKALPAFAGLREQLVPIICYGIYGFGYIIPATFIPAMARDAIADPAVFGWAWPIFGFAALIATVSAGWLSAHVRGIVIWAGSYFIMAAGDVAPVFWPGMGGIVISALCVGGTFAVIPLVSMQEARRISPQNATGVIAAMTAAFALGQILGPMLVSFAAGIPWAMNALLIASAASLVASAIVLLRWRPGMRDG
jgi:predicted MFS family arabinose efflux permease